MKIRLSFGTPEFVPTSKDALEYLFPYEFVGKDLLGMPEEVSETKYFKIKVSISGTLQTMWQLSEDDLLKVLYEYIKRYLIEKIKHDSIRNNEEYSLSTDSHPKKSPYDHTKIRYLESIEIEYTKSIKVPKAPMRKKVGAKPIKKAKIKRRGTIKQKTSIDDKVEDDLGNDPNKILALDSDILNDTSATGILDLGYEFYVNAFVALIDNFGKEMAPLTIGIHGEWGSGKTTLMSAIKKKLDAKKYISILFNAWKYKEEESISRAFLRHSLLQAGGRLGRLKKFKYKLKLLKLNYFVVSIVIITLFFPVAYGVSQFMKWDYPVWLLMFGVIILLILEVISKLQSAGFDLGEKLAKSIGKETTIDFMGNMEKDMQDFIEIYTKIEEDGKPLIVFIDDLDRCPPERIVNVMNAINTITNLENTIFFLGCDTNFVGMAIGNHYSNVLGIEGKNTEITQLEFGLEFLDKIVQIPFRLPRPGFTMLNQFINKVLKTGADSSGGNLDPSNSELQKEDEIKLSDKIEYTVEGPDRENLAAVTSAILKEGVNEFGLSNIRKIKRFINTFRLLYEIGSESGLLRKYRITPQQLGYFLYFHLFNKNELEKQVIYMKGLSHLQLEIDNVTETKDKPKNKVIEKLNIVFTDKDNNEIDKYRILDEFVRGSVN